MSKVTRAKSPLSRLSENQYDLLLYVLSGSILQQDNRPIKWSPSRFSGHTLSKSQAVILSKRLSGLVERGLVKRNGDEVEITDLGRRALSIYADMTADHAKAAYTFSLLRLEDASKRASLISETMELLGSRVLFSNYTYDVSPESMETTKDVLKKIMEKLDGETAQLLIYVQDSAGTEKE